jgi:hypothetical protein
LFVVWIIRCPRATKFLGLAALLLIACSWASFIFGPRYALYRDQELACCSGIEIGEGWIRLGQILLLVAIALIVAAVRIWLQNRSLHKRHGLL